MGTESDCCHGYLEQALDEWARDKLERPSEFGGQSRTMTARCGQCGREMSRAVFVPAPHKGLLSTEMAVLLAMMSLLALSLASVVGRLIQMAAGVQ